MALRITMGKRADSYRKLRLQWLPRLGWDAQRQLAEDLDSVQGVEHVTMGRYSAEVTVAIHVLPRDEVMAEISNVLHEPPTERELQIPDVLVIQVPFIGDEVL